MSSTVAELDYWCTSTGNKAGLVVSSFFNEHPRHGLAVFRGQSSSVKARQARLRAYVCRCLDGIVRWVSNRPGAWGP